MIRTIEFYLTLVAPTHTLVTKKLSDLKKNPFKINICQFFRWIDKSADIVPPAFVPLKSKFMKRDTKLVSEKKNIKFNFNSYFPIKTVNFMRGIFIAEKDNFEKIYIDKIFNSIWRDGLNMNDQTVISKVFKNMDLNPEIFMTKVLDQKIKDKLRKITNDALKHCI